jgi:hypothetical protein
MMKKNIVFIVLSIIVVGCSPKYIVKTHYIVPETEEGQSCSRECNSNRVNCQDRCDKKYNICLSKAREDAESRIDMELEKYDRDMIDYRRKMSMFDKKKMALQRRRDSLKIECEDKIKRHKGHSSCEKIEMVYLNFCKEDSNISKNSIRPFTISCKKFETNLDSCRKKEKDRIEFLSDIIISCRELNRVESDLNPSNFSEPKRPLKPTIYELIDKFKRKCTMNCGCSNEYDRCFESCGGKIEHEKICVEYCKESD